MANEEKFDNVSSFPTLSSSLPGLTVSSLTLAHPVYTFFFFSLQDVGWQAPSFARNRQDPVCRRRFDRGSDRNQQLR